MQELSDEEKQIWNNKAAEGMAIYKKEMEEYNKSISTANNIAVPNNVPWDCTVQLVSVEHGNSIRLSLTVSDNSDMLLIEAVLVYDVLV